MFSALLGNMGCKYLNSGIRILTACSLPKMFQNLMTICWAKKIRKLRFNNRLINYRVLPSNKGEF